MNPERWGKIESIFEQALELQGAAREEFIRRECGEDTGLRDEVKKLIARDEQDEAFLESPVWTDSAFFGTNIKEKVASSLEEELFSNGPAASFSGRKLGPFMLTEQIGKGGMGIVYAAERADGEFSQKVAVKLIKHGMDTDFIVQRFRHERQILASLNHPNIARLIDGGTTPEGSPYFIMEFIEGEPFFAYADSHALDLRARLKLFLAVCDAVSYAHDKKIIHRDIKPSNVIVSHSGVPKLLDFGIAKILDPDLVHETVSPTATQMRLMTPEYASPEQARGDEITTASDQYSLGALLYELVTGVRPYKFASRAPQEIARVICEQIPTGPSSLAATGSGGRETGGRPGLLSNDDFCKQLDKIILKALRKDAAERYPSVAGLAGDIERLLDNRPVLAETFTDKAATASAQILAETQDRQIPVMRAENAVSPRWAGVKQGIFIVAIAILTIPIWISLIGGGFVEPLLVVLVFLLLLLGGMARIVYALLFESKYVPQRPATVAAAFSEQETNIIPPNLPAPEMPRTAIIEERRTAGDAVITAGETSVAVLPFKSLNTMAEADTGGTDFLNVGLADALITRLSTVRQIVVRPTSSVLRFTGNETDSFTAGKDLNVNFVVEGTIAKSQSRIRVSVQLLNVADRAIVWAERFEDSLTDYLSLEDSISQRVAKSLLPKFSAGEVAKLAKRATNNSEAYEAYLRGRFHWNTFTEEGLRQATMFYQRAIRLDPNYALAYAGIADYFIWLGIFTALSPERAYQPAKEMAKRAIKLDPNLAEAYAALGFAELCGDFNWDSSERHMRYALELNPNYAVGHNWLAFYLYTAGRFDEGIFHAKRAVELDPLTYQNYRTLSWGFYFARRYDTALAEIDRTIEKFPSTGTAHSHRSWLLRPMGRAAESVRASQQAVRSPGGQSFFVLLGYAQALAAAGRVHEAEKIVAEVKAYEGQRYVSYYHIALVYCYAGKKPQALAALERALLDREGWLVWLNVEPGLDILRGEARFRELTRAVNLDTSPVAPAPRDTPAGQVLPGRTSVAVLPFKSLNPVAEAVTDGTEFLRVGLADALISRLSNIKQIIVRPTSSVLRYGAGDFDSFAAGRELQVKFVVEGTIVRSGGRVRVSVQMLDVAERSTVWAERYEESDADVLNIEDKIATRVVESLIPQLTGEDRRQLERRGTNNPEAYEAYLRGRYHFTGFTSDGFERALAFYEKAVQLDPNYATAHAGLADYYVWISVYDVMPVSSRAKQAALRAIELDENSSEAYAALGLALLYGEYDWVESEKNLRRAIELGPNNSIAHLWYSHCLYSQGRFDEGLQRVDQALELDPHSFMGQNTYAFAFHFRGDSRTAVSLSEKLIEKFPELPHSWASHATFLNLTGRRDDALEAIKHALKLSNDSLYLMYNYAQILAAAGRRADVEALIERIKSESKDQFFSEFQIALCYSLLNDKEAAFAALDRAYESRESLLVWSAIEPTLGPLREDVRYQELLQKIGHPLASANN